MKSFETAMKIQAMAFVPLPMRQALDLLVEFVDDVTTDMQELADKVSALEAAAAPAEPEAPAVPDAPAEPEAPAEPPAPAEQGPAA